MLLQNEYRYNEYLYKQCCGFRDHFLIQSWGFSFHCSADCIARDGALQGPYGTPPDSLEQTAAPSPATVVLSCHGGIISICNWCYFRLNQPNKPVKIDQVSLELRFLPQHTEFRWNSMSVMKVCPTRLYVIAIWYIVSIRSASHSSFMKSLGWDYIGTKCVSHGQCVTLESPAYRSRRVLPTSSFSALQLCAHPCNNTLAVGSHLTYFGIYPERTNAIFRLPGKWYNSGQLRIVH